MSLYYGCKNCSYCKNRDVPTCAFCEACVNCCECNPNAMYSGANKGICYICDCDIELTLCDFCDACLECCECIRGSLIR